jgi:hypothetical protein
MGANAQTTVPTFTAGQVLTADQQNQSARTGVPVFATTVTRDAAFGGTGEKTLAEGQLCYLEDANVVQYYDGAAWATVGPTVSGVVQVKSADKANSFSTTSGTFVDITDLSISITPTSASNKILVMATLQGSQATGDGAFRAMRDSTVIALSTAGATTNGFAQVSSSYTNAMFTCGIVFLDSPATTSATTYKLQAVATSGTTYVNRRGVAADFGGFSAITVCEVKP